jgi:hypothetical protein
MVATRVRLSAQRRYYSAVHLHTALGDQFFGMTAAGNAGLRQNLLQPFEFRWRPRLDFSLFGFFALARVAFRLL